MLQPRPQSGVKIRGAQQGRRWGSQTTLTVYLLGEKVQKPFLPKTDVSPDGLFAPFLSAGVIAKASVLCSKGKVFPRRGNPCHARL